MQKNNKHTTKYQTISKIQKNTKKYKKYKNTKQIFMNQFRGIRGATTSDGNSQSEIEEATLELLQACISKNDVEIEDIAAAIFTVSQDITTYNPATVARKKLNWNFVPLLDVYQAPISSDLKYCIRVLLLINSNKSQEELSKNFQYLKNAKHLREN